MKSISKLNAELGNTFTQLYYSVLDYIEKHQKEKGYINAQNGENDTMYFYAYNDYKFGAENELVEGRICAIRVKGGGIQILGTINNNLVFTEKDIKNATILTDNEESNPRITINGQSRMPSILQGTIGTTKSLLRMAMLLSMVITTMAQTL